MNAVSADTDVLAPYVPQLVAGWASSAPEARHRRQDGTLVFVDVSGFTKFSERLARHGKVGAEELAGTIDTCFVDLLLVASEEGGDLLKFGGDALLLFFSGQHHAVRACRAAIGMRRALRQLGGMTVFEQPLRLRMSIGVHSGAFDFFLVGDSHRELLVTGPAATTTVEMEAAAQPGEIVVSPATSALLRPGLLGAAKGPGLLLRRAPSPATGKAAPEGVSWGVDDVTPYVPLAVRQAVGTGLTEPEHRKVTVAFVHFEGTDELILARGPEETAVRLEALVSTVQRTVDRLSVAFLGSDIDVDGGKIILTAGAPTTWGDDEGRMLSALREIVDGLTDSPLGLRVGTNRGPVFVGDIGPRARRTFTVMGDGVNLAARLMAKAAPGEILAAPEVLERSERAFETTSLPAFLVKGKAKPVRASRVGAAAGARAIRSAHTPLVGRQRDLTILRELLRSARLGVGGVVELVGDPGIGKTRLLHELAAAAADAIVLSLPCEPYQASTPYFAFREVVRGLLSCPGHQSAEEAVAHVQATIASLVPDLLPWAPLLGPVLDLPIEDTPETAQLAEEFRRPRLGQTMIRLLEAACPSTMLLVADDAHWMDEASGDLLGHLGVAAAGRPWAVVVARRPDSSRAFLEATDPRLVPLGPLEDIDSERLVRAITVGMPIPPHAAKAIAERSGGNPLFIRELVAAARSSDGVESLPDSVESLIAARVDQLDPVERGLLRRAAVLGRTFSVELLRAVSETEASFDLGGLGEFLRPEGGDRFSFRHALVRQCAYDGLPYKLRRTLHSQVADAIEHGAGHGQGEVELLSLHYFHAQRFPEAWTSSLAAAERAERAYADVLAAEFYRRALEAGRRVPALEPAALAATREAMGDAYNRAGQYGAAAVAYRDARRISGGDPVLEARLALKLGRMMGWLDRYSQALRWISKGLRLLDGVTGPEAGGQRAQLMAWYGRFCQEQGRHAQALRWSRLAAAQAEEAEDLDALANALKVVDWASMDLGSLERPGNWERALALFEELGDLTGQASILNFMGGLAYFRGSWEEALGYYRRAQTMVKRTGSAVMEAFHLNNIGEIDLEQGRIDDAEEQLTEASRIWRAAGYRRGTATIDINLGQRRRGQGQFGQALGLFEAAVKEALGVGSQAEALDARSRLAECLLVVGRPAEALCEVDDTLQMARALGGVSPQAPLLNRVRGTALLELGREEDAMAALDESLQAGRARGADYHVALTLRVQSLLYEGDPDRSSTLRAESTALLERLGVVWVPPLRATSGRQGPVVVEQATHN